MTPAILSLAGISYRYAMPIVEGAYHLDTATLSMTDMICLPPALHDVGETWNL
jgi:hypothetical protein